MGSITDATNALDAHEYPATTAALVEAYGHLTLDHPNGTETLGDALSRLTDETYESAEEARLATMSALGDAAIGRKGYSDRNPTAMGEDGPDPVSL